MNHAESQLLVEHVEGLLCRALPATTTTAWAAVLESETLSDCIAAANSLARLEQLPVNMLGAIHKGARHLRENRERAERRALEAAPRRAEPNPEYRRALAELVARFGDQDRRPAYVALADTSSPTSPESPITPEVRNRSLAAARRMSRQLAT